MPRWVGLTVAAVIVLGLAGYAGQPYAKDWWLAREACGGALPGEATDALKPDDEHLLDAEERRIEPLGNYYCNLSFDRGEEATPGMVVEINADSRRDGQDAEMWRTFDDEGWTQIRALPEGMPGFVDQFGAVQLMQKCPSLGEDDDGRPRRILVRTAAVWSQSESDADAVLRMAVAGANRASEQLGCGAEPIEKTGRAQALDPDPVAPARTRGTACEAFAGARLPAGTTVRVRSNSVSPVVRCDLFTGGEGERAEAAFAAWYGDWSKRLVHYDGKRRANTASARCDGEAVSFGGWANQDTGLSERQVRSLVAKFAAQQVEERGCTGLTKPVAGSSRSN